MEREACDCAYEKLYSARMDGLRDGLHDVSERVARLETALARGLMLLVANLLGVVVTLASGLL